MFAVASTDLSIRQFEPSLHAGQGDALAVAEDALTYHNTVSA